MAKTRHLSYPLGMRVRIKTTSSWYSILQKGRITSARQDGNRYSYSVSSCSWVDHRDIVPCKKQPPTLGVDNDKA